MVRFISPRAFACFLSLLFCPVLVSVSPTKEQKAEWQRLYPKLNSKMARMEELLNFIDRFLGDTEFETQLVTKSLEFTFLAQSSLETIPDYIPDSERSQFIEALKQTVKLGERLQTALKASDHEAAKLTFEALDKIRRKSHAKWAM